MHANESGEMETACHCGTVRFRVKLADGFNTARRCTCSYCRMRGAVAVSADVAGITFDAGEEALTFTGSIPAWRSTTSARGAAPTRIIAAAPIRTSTGVNVACLKGLSPFDFADVPVIDGVNHPADHGRGEIVGHLRFIRTEDRSSAGE